MYQFALIGCGEVAKMHLPVMKKYGTVAAVCDIDEKKARELGAATGARVYTDFDQLIAEEKSLDVVCICTPNGCHAEHCIKALQAGRHVLCESPLCLTNAGAWQIIETEKFCRRKLVVVDRVKWNKELQALKAQLDRDESAASFQFNLYAHRAPGYYESWRGKSFPGGGLLYTDFSNYVHALNLLFGEIDEAEGFASNLSHQNQIEFEDAGSVTMKMRSGRKGKIQWSLNGAGEGPGGISINGGSEQLNLPAKELDVRSNQEEASVLERVYENFVDTIREDRPSAQLFEGMRTVAAIEKIYKSILSNPS